MLIDVHSFLWTFQDFDVLVIPGGWAPDYWRRDKRFLDLVKAAVDEGKIVASICHGPWLLCSAKVVKGKKLTCLHSIKDDVINAGYAPVILLSLKSCIMSWCHLQGIVWRLSSSCRWQLGKLCLMLEDVLSMSSCLCVLHVCRWHQGHQMIYQTSAKPSYSCSEDRDNKTMMFKTCTMSWLLREIFIGKILRIMRRPITLRLKCQRSPPRVCTWGMASLAWPAPSLKEEGLGLGFFLL